MIKTRFTLLLLLTFFVSLAGFAQIDEGDGTNPGVTRVLITPYPVVATPTIGSPLAITITVGNPLSSVPISGIGIGNQMSFGITLAKSLPAGPPGSELAPTAIDPTSPILAYFNPTWNGSDGYEFFQKPNVAIPAGQVYDLYLMARVTQLSATTSFTANDPVSTRRGDIGASVNIAPNPNATTQNFPDNDFLSNYTYSTVTTAMPVSLVSFAAQAQDDRTVLVNWTTSWERANKGYIVERSKDLKLFEEVGQVSDVAGTSNSLSKYRFVDAAPYRGTSYYRLRQVDLDGSSQTYKAESVVIDGRYGVYPNPVVSQQFTLDLDEPATSVLRLYNASGSELSVGKSDQTEMSTKVTTPSKLATGVYVLTVEERGTTRKHRLVVQ